MVSPESEMIPQRSPQSETFLRQGGADDGDRSTGLRGYICVAVPDILGCT